MRNQNQSVWLIVNKITVYKSDLIIFNKWIKRGLDNKILIILICKNIMNQTQTVPLVKNIIVENVNHIYFHCWKIWRWYKPNSIIFIRISIPISQEIKMVHLIVHGFSQHTYEESKINVNIVKILLSRNCRINSYHKVGLTDENK